MGGLDCLVNNAGIAGPTAKIEDIDDAAWQNCLDICLNGQFYCVKAALCYLRKSDNPSIVNLSSAAGKYGFALRTPYAAAKWGVVGLTKSLSIELGADNIRVNAILPGLVAGDRQRRVMEAKSQQLGVAFSEIEEAAFPIPLSRIMSPPSIWLTRFYFWPVRAASLSADRHFP